MNYSKQLILLFLLSFFAAKSMVFSSKVILPKKITAILSSTLETTLIKFNYNNLHDYKIPEQRRFLHKSIPNSIVKDFKDSLSFLKQQSKNQYCTIL